MTFARRIAWFATALAWAVQERLLWRCADAARGIFERLSWRAADLGWSVRRSLLWPARDRWDESEVGERLAAIPGKVAVGAAALLVVGAATAGALSGGSGGGGDVTSAAEEPVTAVRTVTEPPIVARTEPKPDGPTLQGARPTFGESADPAEVRKALRMLRENRDEEPGPAEAAGEEPESSTEPGEASRPAGATASASRPDPSKQPLAVARRFSDAFVEYEIGEGDDETQAIMRETASRKLFRSLESRPPRQPSGGGVPRAQIYNLVAKPGDAREQRRKREVTVSVGLLRAGGLAELRLDLERKRGEWRVQTVRG